MADSDSFINEVTEEVRRDRLFGLIRRWGWLAALLVILIVGGAAFLEYRRAQERASAQAFGDALLAALDMPVPDDRVAALDDIPTDTPEATMILALLQSGEIAQAGDPAAAAERLRSAAAAPELPPRYRDLAMLRAEMLDPSDPSEARLILEALAAPGAPYAALAQEQLALLRLREGDLDGALMLFRQIEAGAATTPGLQQRASQLIVALEAGSVLVDTSPEPEVEPDLPPAPGAEDDEGAANPEIGGAETTEDPAATDAVEGDGTEAAEDTPAADGAEEN